VESKYSIDASEGLVRLQVWGELRASTLIRLMAQIAADPQHRAQMAAVVDLREAHGNWDYSEIQLFRDYVARVAKAAELPVPCKWAAIVSPGTLVAAARVLIVISEPLAERIRLRLFEDAQAALRWVRKTPSVRKLDSAIPTS
jgi:hypothetical protein